jgi:drug/metabolite transporter (DMT)-like permease
MGARPATARDPSAAKTLALVALLLGACSIAFAPIFVRLSETGPTASAFWRTALAVPFLWGWALSTPRAAGDGGRTLAAPMLLAGLFFAGDLAVWHFSILFTSVANSTLLANLAPIFVTVGAWALFGQRVTRTFLAGMAIAMAGAFVLVGPSFEVWDPRGPAQGGRQLLGDALGVVTAVFYGAYMLAVKHLRAARSTAHVMAVSTTVTAAVLLPLAAASGETMVPATAAGWATLFGLALVCQSAGQSLIAYAMAHLPASFSSVSLLLQPAMATLYAWALLGERAGLAQLAGGAVILLGIWLARKGS